MKHFALLATAALTLGLWSCQSEEPLDNGRNNGGETKGEFYARVSLDLPSGTRSGTTDWDGDNSNSDAGFEIGKDAENAVNDVTIIMCTYDPATQLYTKVASNEGSEDATPTGAVNPEFTLTFDIANVQGLAEKQVCLFAFCNLTPEQKANLKSHSDTKAGETVRFTNIITDIVKGEPASDKALDKGVTVWKKGNFMMTNAPATAMNQGRVKESFIADFVNIPTIVMPSEADLKKGTYGSPEKAYPLGTIRVARVVSRFDFRQTTIGGQTEANVYPVYKANVDKIEENRIADVKVLAMAPINIAKEFYALPRVSTTGFNDNSVRVLCGMETNLNYVVSPYADKKTAVADLDNEILGKYYFQGYGHKYGDGTYYDYTTIADLLKNEEDNDENWTATDKTGYHIWRYVTENTFPEITGNDALMYANQKYGISTGVVFKAEITNPKAGSELEKAMTAGKDVYSYNGVIYGDIESLRKFVSTLSHDNKMHQYFVKIFEKKNITEEQLFAKNDKGEFTTEISDISAGQNKLEVNGETKNIFKIYRATKEGSANRYYIYYVYTNRHNDNLQNTIMGQMEFATVRNNVYKLSITNISEFGHTSDPDDDDDPKDPDDPDEDAKVYFRVACRVLPWVVRLNGIEF